MALSERIRGSLKRGREESITSSMTVVVPSSGWTDELLCQVVVDTSTRQVTLPSEVEREIERELGADPDVQRRRRSAGV